MQSLWHSVRETISESSWQNNLPKETSILNKSPTILLPAKWLILRPNSMNSSSRWTDTCRRRLSATYSSRCSLTRLRTLIGLSKQVSPKMTSSTDRRLCFSKEVLSRSPLCTKMRSTSVQSWKLICKWPNANSRRVNRGNNSWKRNMNSRGTRTISLKKSSSNYATRS